VPYSNAPAITYTNNTLGDNSNKSTLFLNGGYIIMKAIIANRDDDKIGEYGFLISTDPSNVATYNSTFAKVDSIYFVNDTMMYKIGLDSCMKHFYYKPYLKLNDCDSTIVYGQRKDFIMWHPDLAELTVSPSTTVAPGTQITLNAVATMYVGNWPDIYSRYSTTLNGHGSGDCGLNTNGNPVKTMEEWMHILLDCPFARYTVRDFMNMDVYDTDFEYEWQPINWHSPTPQSAGVVTTTINQTTTYEGSAVFSFRGMVCKVSRTITVTVE
jgi:hypothetical protein